MTSSNKVPAVLAVLASALVGLAGCQRTAPAGEVPAAAPPAAAQGVTLTAQQAQKVGIVTVPAKAADYVPQMPGYGVVVAHDTIAVAVAELVTAQAAQAQSRAVAARTQRLAGTPGAMSADTVESATRQAATDTAALALAQRRLSAVIGGGPPGALAANALLLQELASGTLKLLRATFPLGALQGENPTSLRAARLDGQSNWTVRPVWSAPADASLPGRSFFAVLKGSDAGEGERLLVWAPGAGPPQHGVAVPAAALVISDGKYWCYVEGRPGVYVRREVATDRPLADGYFVTQGVAAGDQVVTAAAGLLLARELNPSTEAD